MIKVKLDNRDHAPTEIYYLEAADEMRSVVREDFEKFEKDGLRPIAHGTAFTRGRFMRVLETGTEVYPTDSQINVADYNRATLYGADSEYGKTQMVLVYSKSGMKKRCVAVRTDIPEDIMKKLESMYPFRLYSPKTDRIIFSETEYEIAKLDPEAHDCTGYMAYFPGDPREALLRVYIKEEKPVPECKIRTESCLAPWLDGPDQKPWIGTIVSGGACRMEMDAMKFALDWGIDICGFILPGKQVYNGVLPRRYSGLEEIERNNPDERDSQNMTISNGVLYIRERIPGYDKSLITEDEEGIAALAKSEKKPFYLYDVWKSSLNDAVQWFRENFPKNGMLYVTGPVMDKYPECRTLVCQILALLQRRLSEEGSK